MGGLAGLEIGLGGCAGLEIGLGVVSTAGLDGWRVVGGLEIVGWTGLRLMVGFGSSFLGFVILELDLRNASASFV